MRAYSVFRQNRSGFTLLETLISAGMGAAVLGILISVSITIQRSARATDHFIVSMNDSNRITDYVARDLRRAVGVGKLNGATHTPIKNNTSFEVSETNILTINVPDVYLSNNPKDKGFRTVRYSRANLNQLPKLNPNAALNGVVPWTDAMKKVNGKEIPAFAPAGSSGEIQVRYYRAPRSSKDKTLCYFRREYSSPGNAALSDPEEIAQMHIDNVPILKITAPNLAASDRSYGRIFHLETSFIPIFRRGVASGSGTIQKSAIRLRNLRRD